MIIAQKYCRMGKKNPSCSCSLGILVISGFLGLVCFYALNIRKPL